MNVVELIAKIRAAGGHIDLYHVHGQDEPRVGITGSVPQALIEEARRQKHAIRRHLEGEQRHIDSLERFGDWFSGRRDTPW